MEGVPCVRPPSSEVVGRTEGVVEVVALGLLEEVAGMGVRVGMRRVVVGVDKGALADRVVEVVEDSEPRMGEVEDTKDTVTPED